MGLAVKVLDWSSLKVVEVGVMETVGAVFTATLIAVEFTATPLLSVT